jgi:hypothetical protein
MKYKYYDWQEGPIDLSHLFSFLLGVVTGTCLLSLFLNKYLIATIWFIILIILISFISLIKKRVKDE